MKTFIDLSAFLTIFLIMAAVGLELTPQDFRRVMRRPWVLVLGTLGQLLIPVVGAVFVSYAGLPAHLGMGVLLVAACPGGGISNFYAYLARANTALSVTMTVCSCLAAVVTMPLALWGYTQFLGQGMAATVPLGKLVEQLVVMAAVPIGLGMALRAWKPGTARRWEKSLQRLSLVGLAFLIGLIVFQEGELFRTQVTQTGLAVVGFTLVLMLLGYGVGWALRLGAADRFTFLVEFSVRNIALAAGIAVTVLGQAELGMFATAYFLIQVPLMLAAVALFRRVRAGEAVPGRGEGTVPEPLPEQV